MVEVLTKDVKMCSWIYDACEISVAIYYKHQMAVKCY